MPIHCKSAARLPSIMNGNNRSALNWNVPIWVKDHCPAVFFSLFNWKTVMIILRKSIRLSPQTKLSRSRTKQSSCLLFSLNSMWQIVIVLNPRHSPIHSLSHPHWISRWITTAHWSYARSHHRWVCIWFISLWPMQEIWPVRSRSPWIFIRSMKLDCWKHSAWKTPASFWSSRSSWLSSWLRFWSAFAFWSPFFYARNNRRSRRRVHAVTHVSIVRRNRSEIRLAKVWTVRLNEPIHRKKQALKYWTMAEWVLVMV